MLHETQSKNIGNKIIKKPVIKVDESVTISHQEETEAFIRKRYLKNENMFLNSDKKRENNNQIKETNQNINSSQLEQLIDINKKIYDIITNKLPSFSPGTHILVITGEKEAFYGEWIEVVNNYLKLKLATDTGNYYRCGQTIYLNINNISSLG